MKKKEQQEIIKGFKGMDANMKCRGYQFEQNKEFIHDGEVSACNSGFHFCENPLDMFNYYAPDGKNKFFEVEGSGKISTHNNDSKVAVSHLKIGIEASWKSIINGAVKFIFEKANEVKENSSATTGNRANSATTGNRANSATTGEYANSATTGNRANSATTGYGANSATTGEYANSATTGEYANSATTGNRANSATTGYGANSATTGEGCISACLNAGGKAKAGLGSFIVLAEYKRDENYNWTPINVRAFMVDGEIIKADTWYELINNEAKETE